MPDWSRRYRRSLLVTGTFVLGSLLAWWAFTNGDVSAQTATTFSIESVGERVGLGNADLRQVGINIIRWLLGFVTLVAVVYLIYGGFIWLTAAGNEQRVEKAKQIILQAIIGLVIIILAWAVVLFVARTVANTTNGNGNTNGTPPCIGLTCPQFNPQTFDLTAVTSCAVPQEFDENVPRSSNISLTFNHDILPASVQAAITPGHQLVIEWCEDDDGDPATPPNVPSDCSQRSTTDKPLIGQVYSGSAPTGAAGSPKAEWVAYDNTVTFYHLSFSTDENNPDNLYFYPNQKYRVTVPAKGSSQALLDTTSPGRKLQNCQSNAAGTPIPGGGCDNAPTDAITWTFTTGTDTAGADLNVQRTVPSSSYLPPPNGIGSGTPDRNVDRENYTFAVEFTQAIDWNSGITPDNNFQLFKCTNSPDAGNGWGCTPAGTPEAGSNFVMKRAPSGTGALVQLASGVRLEPFTWYKAVAKNFRSLCGTEQLPNPFEWVFQTNDKVAGVQFVYPNNGDTNICPDTEVFVKFSTSMHDIRNLATCQPGSTGSFVRTGNLSPNPGRGFVVLDEFDPANPNANCTKYGFTPTTTLLPIGPLTASVSTNLVIDQLGNTLNRSWSFSTTDSNSCVQRPYIDRVSPDRAPAGFCVSVLGNYFEKKQPGQLREADGQGSDSLLLETVDQGTVKSWRNNVIVSRIDDGTPDLAVGPHPYKVSLDYGGSLGVLESNTINLNLEAGSGGVGVCLIDVNPDSGPPGTNTTLSGEGFGGFGASSAVVYSNGPNWSFGAGGWTDTRVSPATVPGTTPVSNGRVHIQTTAGPISNELPFSVTAPGGGGNPSNTIPQVVEETQCNRDLNAGPIVIPSPNPMRNDNQACRNTQVSGRFTLDMDTATINGTNIFLQKCDPTCSTNITASVTAPTARSFALDPSSPLESNTRYQVTIMTGVTSVGPPAVPLAGPYTWQFTTKSGNADCPIDAVTVTTNDAFGNAVQASPTRYVFRDRPYGVDAAAQSVDDQCRTLVNSGVTYAWSSANTQVAVLSSASGPTTLASDPTSAVNGSSTVTVTAENKNATFQVVFDEVSCVTSQQCTLGGQCGGSTCVNNRCTPVVNSIDPNNGPIGKYVTVRGCWFGGYNDPKSKVIFLGDLNPAVTADDRDGLIPDTNICGPAVGTWQNTYIVREVPNRTTPVNTDDAATGPIRVNRFDDTQADGPAFTVNSNPLGTNLCRLNPAQGLVTTPVIASGFGFGADESAKRPAQDQVNITHLSSGVKTVMSTYVSWEDTKVGTAIPTSTAVGQSEVRVVNEGDVSNPWPFEVQAQTGGGCASRCTNDAECSAGQGCGSNFCCGNRPRIVSSSPVQGATGVCRNVQVGVAFDQTINIQPGAVTYSDNGSSVNGRAFTQGATLNYQPGLLTANAAQELNLQSGLIRSQQGVSADLTFNPACSGRIATPGGAPGTGPVPGRLCFRTGADVCRLDQVRIRTGVGFTVNSHRFTSIGEVMDYRAEALSNQNGGTVIVPIPGTYAWTWAWTIGQTNIATLVSLGSPANNPNDSRVTAVANGRTFAQATATVTEDTIGNDENRALSGQGEVIVDACDNPWNVAGPGVSGFDDSVSNCDRPGGGCDDFNFKLAYCRGQTGQNLLPDFSYQGTNSIVGVIEGKNATDPTRLKSIFFKEDAESRDAIGLLVFDNPNLLSPHDWFSQRFPQDTGGSTTTIGGYPALRTGTTAYIGVTDCTGTTTCNGPLRGLMFVIDFNSNNASSATQNIYNQLLNSLTFNTNLTDITQRQQLINDTRRVQDLAGVKVRLEDYKTDNGNYPGLESGSYLIGMSTSAWPSWQQTLGNTLGRALGQDPQNTFTDPCVAGDNTFEPSTCWSETKRQFQCPAGSHVYAYRAGTNTFSLYAQLEYTGSGSFINASGVNACSGIAGSSCQCFNYRLTP